jgi:hypothetical protein
MRHTGSDVLALTAAYAGGILAHLKNLSNDLKRRRNASGYTSIGE